MSDSIENIFKDIILNTNVPLKLKNINIPWNCFEKDFESWCTLFDQSAGKTVSYQQGFLKYHDEPQWERIRKNCESTIKDMIYKCNEESWNYFGYTNIMELPIECRSNINFEFLGFTNISEDISVWIGTRGAHTPCHYDTYGCNVIVQVYGRYI